MICTSDWCLKMDKEFRCCVSYLGPTEHFVSDVVAGVDNAVTVQLQGNDWTFIGGRKPLLCRRGF